MYGLWYFVIAMAVAAIALIVCAIIKAVNQEWCEDYIGGAKFVTFLTVLLIAISIFMPLDAKKEIREFEYQKQIVEESVENGTQIENIAITQTIIEKNEWLSEAKANLETFGCFSKYYNSGIENIEPIKIKKEIKNEG